MGDGVVDDRQEGELDAELVQRQLTAMDRLVTVRPPTGRIFYTGSKRQKKYQRFLGTAVLEVLGFACGLVLLMKPGSPVVPRVSLTARRLAFPRPPW